MENAVDPRTHMQEPYQESIFRTLFEQAGDGIAYGDSAGRLLDINDQLCRMLGRTRAELIGAQMRGLGISTLEDVAGLEKRITEQGAATFEAELQRPDGTRLPVEVSAVALQDRRRMAIVRDISARLRTETELRTALQRLQLAAEAARIGIWTWNFADGSLEWDDRMCEMYGVPDDMRAAKLYYDVWRSRVHPADLAAAEPAHGDPSRIGAQSTTLFRIVLPGGAIRYIEENSVMDYDRDGRPVRMIGINRDVTDEVMHERLLQDANAELEQRVAERTAELAVTVDELRRANAGKDAFLAAISHELRTPLTGILGMADILGEEVRGPLNDYQKRYVAGIQASGNRLLAMVTSILNYIHAMSDRQPGELETCRLVELCAASIRAARPKAEQKRQQIVFAVDPVDLTIVSNADAIQQVLNALLDNAIKFTPEAGSVGLEVTQLDQGRTVEMVVWDTGVGIAPEQFPYLFKPFTQIDQQLSRQYEGIGLGLALVKRMVELLGGSVAVTSEAGQGARFTVALPASPAP